ncbi:antirestriction protein ArdA [Enterococcus sp. LJL90]
MSEIKIYVELLGQKHKGEWFSLPVPPSTVSQKLGMEDVGSKETIISDYEAPFVIHETDRIEKLNVVVERFKEMPAVFQKYTKVLLDEYFQDIQSLLDGYSSGSFVSGIASNSDLGRYLCGEGEFYKVPSELESFIDYDAMGRDYAIVAVVIMVDDGAFIF